MNLDNEYKKKKKKKKKKISYNIITNIIIKFKL